MSEARPIDLGLLAGQRAQAQIGLGHRLWSQRGDQVAEVIAAADITARHRHRMQARRGQRRALGQRLRDERPKRIDAHRRQWRGGCRHPALGEHPAVSRCTCNWRAMVRARQCSTSRRRGICALKLSGMVIGASWAVVGGTQRPAHRRTVAFKARPHPRLHTAAAPSAPEGRIGRCDRLGSACRQLSIAGSDERTLMRHDVAARGQRRERAACNT